MKLLQVREKFNSDQEFIEAVNEQLKKLMTENPDFVYSEGGENCSYRSGPSSNPSLCSGCIFDQALQALGWNEPDEMSCSFIMNITGLLERYINEHIEIPRYWPEIQQNQDSGIAWGKLLGCFNE